MGSLPNLSVIKGPTREFQECYVDQLFESVANGAAADNIAVIFEENGGTKRHTYSDLNTTTTHLSKVIVDLAKTAPNPRNTDNDLIVAVSLHPSDKLITTLLAIWKAGAAYLPLDPTFPQHRIDHILQESQPFLVITEDDNFKSTTMVKTFNELLQLVKLDDFKNNSIQKQEVAIVLYTSGSTGVPKGVRIPHRAIQNRLYWQFKTFPYGDDENVCVFKTALTFVDSVAEIWGPLINGLSLLVVPKSVTKDPQVFIGLLERYKIERLVLVPSLLRSLLMYLEMQKEKSLLHKLKTWVCSGETLAVSLVEDFFKYFPENEHQLCNFYGSTEIMGDVTYHIISNPQQLRHQTKVPIGLPVDNTTIHLLTATLTPVKPGEIGELFVSGLNLALGYVNQRDPHKFLENPLAATAPPSKLYRTGDYARLDKGIIVYEGRTDSQIKIRGHRVDLNEVEKALVGFEEVEKAVVLCYRAGELNQALLGFVVARRGGGVVSESEIEGKLLEKLPEYMVPQVVLIKDIPLLVNGKVDRQALLKSYENNNNEEDLPTFKPQIDYTGVPETNMAAAKILFETIASVLQRSARQTISIKSNFFESGGNSLNSIYTITRLNEQGYQIGIGDFLAAKTLGDVLEKMDGNQNVALFGKFGDNYEMELLKDEHQEAVIDIITTSFYRKAELERYIAPLINESDYAEVIIKLWDTLKAQNISFVVKTGPKIIGVALNTDARDEPEIEINSKLTIILEFLEFIEGPIRDNQLPAGKRKIFHSFMMGTHSSLSAQENVSVMHYMEEQVIRVAKENNYAGILTTNTNPLTQQLGRDVYKYETLLEYTFNKYVDSEGKRPFAVAPDHEGALVQWKPI